MAPAIRPTRTGLKTDYLWKQVLTPWGLTDIIENYAQIVEIKDPKTGKKKREQIFPRYHQLDVVRKLLRAAERTGCGKTLSDSAFCGEWKIEFDRLAGASAHWSAQGRERGV